MRIKISTPLKILPVLLFFLVSCDNLEMKLPPLPENLDQSMQKVTRLGKFSRYECNVAWSQSGDNDPSNDLKLFLYDWQALPDRDKGMDSLAQKVATILIRSTKNRSDYDWITIAFLSSEGKAAIPEDLKHVFVYRPDELK